MVSCILLSVCLFSRGVVITDNVWFYSTENHSSTIFCTGDTVKILASDGDLMVVEYNGLKGKIHKGVLIDLEDEIARDQLFVYARGYFDNGEYEHAITLFDLFNAEFPHSDYYPEALYYTGLAHEEIAKIPSWADTVAGLVYNDRYNIWYYPGDTYMAVLERFPDCEYASKAAYRLINIYRMSILPWGDSAEPVFDEIGMWEEFIDRFQDSEEYVPALLEMGYLYRVLFEITGDSDYKVEAATIFQLILDECTYTIYAAQARVNLFELAHEEKIYKY
jgi:tetratricopeptide (TPR) repeat protein